MVRRIFWMTVGAGAAVWAMNKANEATRRLTPDSLSGTAARGALHLGDAAKRFAQDVRTGMAEREEQLRADLGLDGTAVLEPAPRRRRTAAPRGAEYRAISAAPGSPGVALPPSRAGSTPPALTSTPRQLEQRRGKHP
ncbi:hypothetical protein GCM10009665_30860 [Kitasatospora nipponensis]|uniref:Secreted protein n=1 Tax=Kitasatospora nipponensis TaxID=258049 RepID=A0ABP4GVD0_9ACTN